MSEYEEGIINRLAQQDIPSMSYMAPEEKRRCVIQMLDDLHQLAVDCGCVAAAWAFEFLIQNPP